MLSAIEQEMPVLFTPQLISFIKLNPGYFNIQPNSELGNFQLDNSPTILGDTYYYILFSKGGLSAQKG